MTQIRDQSDSEDTATEYLAPVTRGLEGLHFINKTAAKAAKNYARGKNNGVFVGAPLIADAQSLRLKGLSAYIQTDVVEAAVMTIFSVVKTADTLAADANRPMFYGTFQSPAAADPTGNTFGVSLYGTSATLYTAGAGRGTTNANDTSGGKTIAVTPTTWALMVQEIGVGANAETRTTNQTTGVTGITTLALPRYPSAGRFRIGSGYEQFSGHGDVALWQAHSVLLDASEIATVVADIRAHMARRAITV